MNKITKLTLLWFLMMLSPLSYAICVQNNNTLSGLVGLDSTTGNVYATTNSTTNECSCANVRFVASNTDAKMALSILLSAKMADKKVRIDLLDANDCNTAIRVYVQ